MRPFVWLLAVSVAAGTLLAPAGDARAQLLITGNDEKISFDRTGKTVTHPPSKDTVSIIDIREPHQAADRCQSLLWQNSGIFADSSRWRAPIGSATERS
jgi:hypothetical protein